MRKELIKFIVVFILAGIMVCGFVNRTIILSWKKYDRVANPDVDRLAVLEFATDSTFDLTKVVSESVDVNLDTYSYVVDDTMQQKKIYIRMAAIKKNGIVSKMSDVVEVDLNRPDRVQELRATIKRIW